MASTGSWQVTGEPAVGTTLAGEDLADRHVRGAGPIIPKMAVAPPPRGEGRAGDIRPGAPLPGPSLVTEVDLAEWTHGQRIRQPAASGSAALQCHDLGQTRSCVARGLWGRSWTRPQTLSSGAGLLAAGAEGHPLRTERSTATRRSRGRGTDWLRSPRLRPVQATERTRDARRSRNSAPSTRQPAAAGVRPRRPRGQPCVGSARQAAIVARRRRISHMSARRPRTQTTAATPQVSATHAANMPPDTGWLWPESARLNGLPSASMKLITWLLALWASTSTMTAGTTISKHRAGTRP